MPDPSIPHSRPTVGQAEAEAVQRVVLSGNLAQGGEVEAFEEEVAAFIGRRYAVAVSSGSAALHLALLALGVGQRDEVVVPSYVCNALLHAVSATGARPIVADIEAPTRNLDAASCRQHCSAVCRAIILPHMFGLPVAVEAFQDLGVALIEDCAMSIGAEFAGSKVGAVGEMAICSFYATKVIATGEGGMVLTDKMELAKELRALRQYDGLPADRLRFNCKMSDMAAALGRVQLRRLPEFIERRRSLAARYDEAFAGLAVECPPSTPGHIYFRYVVGVESEVDVIIDQLEARSVSARRPIYQPLHRELGAPDSQYPRATAAYARDLSLPLYPSLDEVEIERVIDAVCQIAQGKRN